METEQGWMKKYNCAVYVSWSALWSPDQAAYTRDCAGYLGLELRGAPRRRRAGAPAAGGRLERGGFSGGVAGPHDRAQLRRANHQSRIDEKTDKRTGINAWVSPPPGRTWSRLLVRMLWLSLFADATDGRVGAASPRAVETIYSRRVYPFISQVWGFLFGWVPFLHLRYWSMPRCCLPPDWWSIRWSGRCRAAQALQAGKPRRGARAGRDRAVRDIYRLLGS